MQIASAEYPSQVDQTNCDREPIHIIGKAQAHGVILACNKKSFFITQCSENSGEILGFKVEDLLGKPLSILLPEDLFKNLKPGRGEKVLLPEVKIGQRNFIIVAHVSGGSLLLEFEPVGENLNPLVFQEQLTRILNDLTGAETINEMCNRAAHLVKMLYGYDRVMLYHFDEEWNGEVIAEEREEHLESWLGLHYPATDIPKPSRELFLKQGVRIISDVHYTPSPIQPEISPVNNKPLDLSRSELRAVSPIHIQYLKNMKVGASLTAAIVLNGKLWGLLACHHYSPKFVNYHQRQSVKFLTQIFTNRLAVKTTETFLEKTQQFSIIRQKLIDQMAANQDVIRAITQESTLFTDLIPSSGGAVLLNGKLALIGNTPSEEEVRDLIFNVLHEEKLFYTASLEKTYPAASAYKKIASGVLSVKIGESEEDYLVWFRPETAQEVSWGGKPEKNEIFTNGMRFLSPRGSFEKWTQQVSGISTPWKNYEFEAALALRENITHKIVQQQKAEIKELNKQLTLVNKELEAYSYSISHDLRAPLRGISGYTRILLEDHIAQLDENGVRALQTIQRSAEGMSDMIKDLLLLARLGSNNIEKNTVSLQELVIEILDALNVKENYANSEIIVQKGLPSVVGEKQLLNQLLTNLIGNALKYSAAVPQPRVEIGFKENDETSIVFFVKDNGIGFNPKLSTKIFQVFSRLVGEDYSGTGIGLAIAKKVVDKHQGRIWVETLPGVGSTFYFTLGGN